MCLDLSSQANDNRRSMPCVVFVLTQVLAQLQQHCLPAVEAGRVARASSDGITPAPSSGACPPRRARCGCAPWQPQRQGHHPEDEPGQVCRVLDALHRRHGAGQEGRRRGRLARRARRRARGRARGVEQAALAAGGRAGDRRLARPAPEAAPAHKVARALARAPARAALIQVPARAAAGSRRQGGITTQPDTRRGDTQAGASAERQQQGGSFMRLHERLTAAWRVRDLLAAAEHGEGLR